MHETDKFEFDKDDGNQRIFKCFNCKENDLPHNHRANDVQCPMRTKYIEIKTNSNRKNGRNANSNFNANSGFILNANVFPPLRASAPPPLTHSFADAARPQPHRLSNDRNVQNHTDSNELFTFAQISEIMLNCVNELTKCKKKVDQLRVIANVLGHAFK